jgi:CRISPR-associated endonuclease Csn1
VNNLRLEAGGGERFLSDEERSRLVQVLELEGDRRFAQARKLLNLPKELRFTIERGGEKNVRGNRTTSAFYKAFGERWLEMSAPEHEQALHDVLSIEDENVLKRRAVNFWKLDENKAAVLAEFKPEPDYFNLSRKAMEKFMPLLEQGVTYAEARRQIYPEKFQAREPLPLLPRLDGDESRQAVGEIRNPAVTRGLTELRKVVNAVVRQYGKPVEVRIELARDLKRSRKDRKKLTERNRENEAGRERAKRRILEEAGVSHPRRDDVRKALLWDECGGICPYTGKPIPFKSLFGDSPQFDIEHILPRERSFDDAFTNLTLCGVHENRHVKGGRTPWEAYGNTEHWEQILDRVRRFRSESARTKLWRFQMTESEATEFVSKFRERQLNDTRYASRLAAKYVAVLYGGLSDDEHTRRVHVTSGEVTAQLRSAWKLNGILNDGRSDSGGEVRKTRDDHRHHAVDAVAIALTDDGRIQQLSRAAEWARERGQRKLGSLDGPWPNFVDSVREHINQIVVSHRVSRKVSGALHEETIYSPPFRRNAVNGKELQAVRVRRKLEVITAGEIRDIVDEAVRKLVQDKLSALGGGDGEKVFKVKANLPCFTTADGRRIPIKSARVEKRLPAKPLGVGRSVRHVTSESNHHVEIYAEIKPDGSEGGWGGEVVSTLEAHRRKKAGKPVVEKDHGPRAKFKFSLAPNEVIECDDGKDGRILWVVRGTTTQNDSPRVFLVALNDARQRKEMDSKAYWRPFLNPLRNLHARKVAVTPLGEVREAHD